MIDHGIIMTHPHRQVKEETQRSRFLDDRSHTLTATPGYGMDGSGLVGFGIDLDIGGPIWYALTLSDIVKDSSIRRNHLDAHRSPW